MRFSKSRSGKLNSEELSFEELGLADLSLLVEPSGATSGIAEKGLPALRFQGERPGVASG